MDSDTALTVIAAVLVFYAVLIGSAIATAIVTAVGAAILQERESREKPDDS